MALAAGENPTGTQWDTQTKPLGFRHRVTLTALLQRYGSVTLLRYGCRRIAVMASCRSCGQPIYWQRRGGKNYPLDPDGGIHWAKCRPAVKLEVSPGVQAVGASYVASCGCDVSPWEFCACSFKSAGELFNEEADERLQHLLDLVDTA